MDDTCSGCGHLVDHHDAAGCFDPGSMVCGCTLTPQHYDPSDD